MEKVHNLPRVTEKGNWQSWYLNLGNGTPKFMFLMNLHIAQAVGIKVSISSLSFESLKLSVIVKAPFLLLMIFF